LAIAHDKVESLQPMKIHAQRFIIDVGPKHEGRIA
jgi:hypothetical protein